MQWLHSTYTVFWHSGTATIANTCKAFVSRIHFDANLFSEPLALMNVIWEYERLSQNGIEKWCKFHNLFPPRIRRLASTTVNLRKRVSDFLGLPESVLQVSIPPSQMPHGMVVVLRVIQVWVFNETMIQFDPKTLQKLQKKCTKNDICFDIQQKSDMIERIHLQQILSQGRHAFTLMGSSEIRQKGAFEYINSGSSTFRARLENHFISYATEKKFDFVCISFQSVLMVYIQDEPATINAVVERLQLHRKEDTLGLLIMNSCEGKPRRGIGERACGAWTVQESSRKGQKNAKSVSWLRYGYVPKNQKKNGKKELKSIADSLRNLARTGSHKCILLNFPWACEEIAPNRRFQFTIDSFGTSSPMNAVDMRDILGPNIECSSKEIPGKQKISFDLCESQPRPFKKRIDEVESKGPSSWDRPLMKCIPEGARLVSVLASNRRRENVIKLVEMEDRKKDDDDDDDDEDDTILTIYLDRTTNASFRWKRFNTNDMVFIDANSVPATAVPLEDSSALYCVCANTLEVRGGGLRAEGLTLLPQGKAFLLLSRFTFGLFRQDNVDDGSIIDKALTWIGVDTGNAQVELLADKIEKAVHFHEAALDLGETLECFPDKVALLLDIFDGVDGYEAKPWDTLPSNPLIRQNLLEHQKMVNQEKTRRFFRRESSGVDDLQNGNEVNSSISNYNAKLSTNPTPTFNNGVDNSKVDCESNAIPEMFSRVVLSEDEMINLNNLFRTSSHNIAIGSCEILAQVINELRTQEGKDANMSIINSDWQFFCIELKDSSSSWYKVVFQPKDIPYKFRSKETASAAWMTKNNHWTARPRTISQALDCIPSSKDRVLVKPKIRQLDNVLVFQDMDVAIQMEVAFWLERQCRSNKYHWYERTLNQMVGPLRAKNNENTKKTKKKTNKNKKKKNGDNNKK